MAPHSYTSNSEVPDGSSSSSFATRRKHQRIPRACDRCRMKKAKCDGRHQCSQCAAHDSPCTYTHRKHHPATNYYLQMLNLSNEAILKLYAACRDSHCFPGEMPTDEQDQNVSIHAILKGLGLLTNGTSPFDPPISPSEDSDSKRQSHTNPPAPLPDAHSGCSDPSLDPIEVDITTSSLHQGSLFHPGPSRHSSTSHHSFDDRLHSPTTQPNNPFESCQQDQTEDVGPPFMLNLDFLSFDPHCGSNSNNNNNNNNIQLANVASADDHIMSLHQQQQHPFRSDFLFPWSGSLAAAIDTADYHEP